MLRSQTVREIEIKLRIDDVPELISRLHGLGAACSGRVFEQNTLYDTADSDFHRSGRLLRLRLETPARSSWARGGAARAVLTSKLPVPLLKSRYKEKLEREVVARSPRRYPAILRSLGFRTGFYYEKYRTTFHLPHLHLVIDETPIGTFLELEGVRSAIDRASRALGFSPRDYIRGTYWDLFQADCRRRRRFPRNMRFHA
jgi:adenylate cyclase, class 2